jgi:hypothetical protein
MSANSIRPFKGSRWPGICLPASTSNVMTGPETASNAICPRWSQRVLAVSIVRILRLVASVGPDNSPDHLPGKLAKVVRRYGIRIDLQSVRHEKWITTNFFKDTVVFGQSCQQERQA